MPKKGEQELMKLSPALAVANKLMQLPNPDAEFAFNLIVDEAQRQVEIVRLDEKQEAAEAASAETQVLSTNEVATKLAELFRQGYSLGSKVNMKDLATEALVMVAKKKAREVKRQPLLIDEFLSTPLLPAHIMPKNRQEVLRDRLRQAKVFVFDSAATRYASEMMRDHTAHIALDQEFAIPPFPVMYMEYPVRPLFDTLGQPTDEFGDKDVGYFIDGPRAYVLSRMEAGSNAAGRKADVLPILYRLNKPFTFDEERRMVETIATSRIGLDDVYWGSLAHKVQSNRNVYRMLRAQHSFEWLYATEYMDYIQQNQSKDPTYESMLQHLLVSGAGDLRNIIGMLLFLNRTSQIRFEESVGPHRGFVGPKPATFLRHNIVRIKLDPKPMLKRLYGKGGTWKREHDVRGHFCHDKKARESGHRMAVGDVPQTHEPQWREIHVNYWGCTVCGGKRWHRAPHKRGHREKGEVVKAYEVTK